MEKSIEQIWKEGFINENNLIIPKLNNLYNQKSIHLIDKFKKRFKVNHYYIIGLAFFMLIIGIVIKAPIAGCLMFILLLPLIFISKRNSNKLINISYSDSSYIYLKSFDNYLKGFISGLGNYYQLFYPLFVAIMSYGFVESFFGEKFLKKIMSNPNTTFWNGIPIIWLGLVIIIIILAGIFAKPLYKFDLKIGYGNIINQLESLVSDMEELRK